jgi:hypothetical protein
MAAFGGTGTGRIFPGMYKIVAGTLLSTPDQAGD